MLRLGWRSTVGRCPRAGLTSEAGASHALVDCTRLHILLSKMLRSMLDIWLDTLYYELNTIRTMINENHEPNDREEEILTLFKQGRTSNDPWGRVNPLYLREHSTLDKGQVEYALRNLTNAGWVEQLNKGGLYEFVADPRETDT